MKRPIEPNVPASDSFARRVRDSIRDTLRWIDAGTRTQELTPTTTVDDADLFELVKPDGVRYRVTADKVAGAGVPGPAGPAGPAGATGPTGPAGANGTNGKDGASSDLYLYPPSSPDSWDLDPALMTTADLSTYGWSVSGLNSPWTVLTRSGDVQLTGNPAAGNYWSTLRNGILTIKVPSTSSGYLVWKATSGAHMYKAHAWPANWDGSPNDTLIFIANGNHPGDAANSMIYMGRDTNNMLMFTWIGAAFTSIFSIADTAAPNNQDRVLYLTDPAGSGTRNITGRIHETNGVYWRAGSLGSTSVTFNGSVAGLFLAAGNATGPNLHHIGSIRRLATTDLW